VGTSFDDWVAMNCRDSSDTVHHWTVNPLMGTLKLQSIGPLYDNTVIGTLAVDG